jgi:cytidyltransferase-like protein
MSISRGMVFGVYDGLHEGHKYFLTTAKSHCDELLIVVASDIVVEALKGKKPKFSMQERKEALKSLGSGFTIVDGDESLGEWTVIDSYDPDRVYLGYDQSLIGREMKRQGIPFTYLEAYKPNEFKSSLMNRIDPQG